MELTKANLSSTQETLEQHKNLTEFSSGHGPRVNLAIKDLKSFGDRTSHFSTLNSQFETFSLENEMEGQIRYVGTTFYNVVGSEPLCEQKDRVAALKYFLNESQKQRKHVMAMPVSEHYAKELEASGFYTVQVGVEPIFELQEIFSEGYNPLVAFSHARSLQKKGHIVEEINPKTISIAQRNQINSLHEEWLSTRKSTPLNFLNTVNLWEFIEEKRLFILKKENKIKAFVLCTPIYPEISYFFSDYFRENNSKPGTMELLFLETLRLLHQSGVKEARFGLCPFQGLSISNFKSKSQRKAFQLMQYFGGHVHYPMNFQSLYRFKLKFNPSRLEPLFLASSKSIGLGTLGAIVQAHYPELSTTGLTDRFKQGLLTYLPQNIEVKPWPSSIRELLARTSLTLTTCTFFGILHLGRIFVPAVDQFYQTHGFTAGSYQLASHFWGPLFHNNWKHFLGDISTYLMFVGTLEVIAGKRLSTLIAAVGLWGSNLLAWGTLSMTLSNIDPVQYQKFLTESDWGSSNAIYAAAGALATFINRPALILIPFFINGIILSLGLHLWISIHHLLALTAGFFLAYFYHKIKRAR